MTSSSANEWRPDQGAPPAGAFELASIPGLKGLWAETLGDPSICIAVLDGPVDLSHRAFLGADIQQLDLFGRVGGLGQFAIRHGTHVASVIFGQHGGPVRGLAPRCRGLVIPIYAGDETRVTCSQEDLAIAIEEAIRQGAHIINISGGELSEDGSASKELREAIRDCTRLGRLVVAAAGNEGCEQCLHVPGALPAVLTVGAMDSRGEPLQSSNWGDAYKGQGVLAPGKDIPGAVPGDAVAVLTGTSFATPIVSGIAGLLLGLQKKRGQNPDPFLVREALIRSARGCDGQTAVACGRFLAGRLDLDGAISFLIKGDQSMSDQIDAHDGAQSPELAPSTPDGPHGAGGQTAFQGAGHAMPSDVARAGSPPGRQGGGMKIARSSIGPSCSCGCGGAAGGCGCGGSGLGQKVYAVGELGFDFGTRARRDSIQANAPSHPDLPSSVEDVGGLLRYLLGMTYGGDRLTNGNLYDADSICWILKQGDCPLYAIRPQGPYAQAAYKQLIIFLIEQSFFTYQDFQGAGIGEDCIQEFYQCFGGVQENFRDSLSAKQPTSELEQALRAPAEEARGAEARGPEPQKGEGEQQQEQQGPQAPDILRSTFALFQEGPGRAAHIAIPGVVTGRVRLYSGEEVEVIDPVMRGMQNWNTARLIEVILNSKDSRGLDRTQVTISVLKLIANLYDAVRNPGKSPCDRAKNYFATKELLSMGGILLSPTFLSMLGAFDFRTMLPNDQWSYITANGLTCKEAACQRYGSETYDVELTFYNFANQFMGSAVITQPIDVSDCVPVPTDSPRAFTRRS